MRIRLDLDQATTDRLIEIALAERRPSMWPLMSSFFSHLSGLGDLSS